MSAMSQKSDATDTSDHGEFVDSDDEVTEYSESPYRYDESSRPYYPIRIGELLNETYLIEHKLGHGGFATVWMAYDIKNKKNVALKIMTAGDSGEHEHRALEEIKKAVKNTTGLVISQSAFFLRGRNSNHRVFVFPLLGPCLDALVGREIPMASRMSAAKQLLEALANLHEGGIVHRDINNKNIMWGMAPLEKFDKATKYKLLGRPLKVAIPDEPWREGEVVKPIEVPDDLRTEDFYLGDFGLAMRAGTPVTQQGRPPIEYCSPERLHNHDPSFACDMWSYMCIFMQLYLGMLPFHTWATGGVATTMVQILGPMPAEWKGHYCPPEKTLDSWYNQDDMPDVESKLKELILRKRPNSSPIEQKHALSVLSKGLQLSPEKRPTAKELLRDPSFMALIDIHCH
ncbi:protein kinase domain-containing protein [Arthroderma uncinatum]|uniref:protein kinase domain-containing protein n=1 Tax=Arthroderma uncinatum TaxID=74035 RepID=UPI00144AB518|nr:protein kinase domain-containing protein [Arthroderma uncinatum]KAF3482360.1 protein kinase domain-containing protein [Arthroderma uncinatum]